MINLQKQKKIPQRKCIACQDRDAKRDLVRIVKNKEGQIFLDKTGKANGRGAYIKKDLSVLEQAKKTMEASLEIFGVIHPANLINV